MKKLFSKPEVILMIGKPSIVFREALRKVAFFLAVLITATFFGCEGEDKSAPAPNIILITIDTLRADHLSCYGYSRETSPFIDSIAKKGIVFTNGYSTSSWTSPSMASIFTALYPRSHGVLHGFVSKNRIVNQETLSADFTTLAEVLQGAGYTTFGVSSNPHMSSETGFDQGFDYYTTLWFTSASAVNNVAEEWKKEIQNSSKYFLWIHYFDPHDPYRAREPWIKNYNAHEDSYRKWSRMVMKQLRPRLAEIQGDRETRQALEDLYDSEINFCDHYLQELFEALSLGKNSVVIITSDHGEEFLDHGGLGHAQTLYEEATRVPLILKLSDNAPASKIFDQPVSNKDIFPTILDAVGIEIPAKVRGRTLLPLITGDTIGVSPAIYTELDRGGYWEAIRRNNWKFLLRGKKQRERFLYDLTTDLRERKNLLAREPDIARELEAELDEWMNAHPVFLAPRTDKPLNKGQEQKLRSLGYLK